MQIRKVLVGALGLCSFAGTAGAVVVEWKVADGGNGHFYEYVADEVDWPTALDAAAARTYAGLTGYLATITSDAENDFVTQQVSTSLGWIGGSDDGSEGSWTWRTGPEAGTAFDYTHWNPGEPNNCCNGENYLQLNWSLDGGWNDHGGPGAGVVQKNGYFVEYSAPVPEPGTWALLAAGLGLLGLARRRR